MHSQSRPLAEEEDPPREARRAKDARRLGRRRTRASVTGSNSTSRMSASIPGIAHRSQLLSWMRPCAATTTMDL